MFQALKGKTKKIVNAVAASVLLFSQLAMAPVAHATAPPNPNDWPYWCGQYDGGVKFDTGAVGTHSQNVTGGSVSITIVDPDKTEVSDVTGTGVDITKVVIKGGNEDGGNQVYMPPFEYNLKAPNNNGGQQSDISHVIVCYDKVDTGNVKVNKKVDANGNGFYEGGNTAANNLGFDWSLDNETPGRNMGTSATTSVGAHTVTEDSLPGYVFTGWYYTHDEDNSGADQVNCTYPQGTTLPVNLTVKKDKTTEITLCNQFQEGTITLIKEVVNNNGGTAGVNDFGLTIGDTSVESGETLKLSPGSYALNEQGLSGYQFVSITGDDECPEVLGGVVELKNGDDITCTIKNDDVPAQLRVIKDVTNDNGGDAVASDFTLYVNGDPKTQNQYFSVNPGTYTVTEDGPDGYTQTGITCVNDANQAVLAHPVNVALGQSVTCTVYNDDKGALLTVIKHVVNNNGGTKVAPDFTMYVSGTSVSDDEFPGDEKGTTVSLHPGSYSVTENGLAGYTGTRTDGCTGSIALGEHKYCTITNDDDAPVLVLIKKVLNYNGGTATETDWLLSATGPTSISGWGGVISGSEFSAGSYDLSESDGPSGYTPSSWTCIGGSQEGNVINLGLGETAACTIVNSDNPAKITVTKEVVNDNGGTAEADDFTLWVGNTKVVSGTSYEFAANETYTVGESDGPKGYEQTSLTCVDTTAETTVENPFKAELGHNYECTIVNNDVAPTLKIKKWTVPFRSEEQFNFSSEELDTEFTLGSGDSKNFEDLQPGTYTVTEAGTDGWFLKNIYCWGATDFSKNLEAGSVTITLELGDEATCKFLNAEFGSVSGFKFEDVNGDGHFDGENEPKLSGWTITLTKLCQEQNEEVSLLSEEGYTCETFEDSTVTGDNGRYSFDNLKPGLYKVCEVLQDGWIQTKPGTEDGCRKVWVGFGSDKFVKFGNFKLGEIKGVKFNDVNGNGTRDNGEPTLRGWTIKLTKECAVDGDAVARFFDQAPEEEGCDPAELTAVTDANGAYSFTGLEAGDYTVCEVQQANWTQTFPADNNGCHKVTVVGDTSGEVITADFGNKAKPQVLGESTLVNTGASTSKGLLVGLSILGALGALHLMVRRKSYTN